MRILRYLRRCMPSWCNFRGIIAVWKRNDRLSALATYFCFWLVMLRTLSLSKGCLKIEAIILRTLRFDYAQRADYKRLNERKLKGAKITQIFNNYAKDLSRMQQDIWMFAKRKLLVYTHHYSRKYSQLFERQILRLSLRGLHYQNFKKQGKNFAG